MHTKYSAHLYTKNRNRQFSADLLSYSTNLALASKLLYNGAVTAAWVFEKLHFSKCCYSRPTGGIIQVTRYNLPMVIFMCQYFKKSVIMVKKSSLIEDLSPK